MGINPNSILAPRRTEIHNSIAGPVSDACINAKEFEKRPASIFEDKGFKKERTDIPEAISKPQSSDTYRQVMDKAIKDSLKNIDIAG